MVFYDDPSLFSRDVINQQVPVGTGMWEISGMPARGWSAAAAPRTMVFLAGGLAVILLIAALIFVVSAWTDSRIETPISSVFSLDSPKICLVYLDIDKPSLLVFACGPPSSPGKNGCDPPGGHPFSQNARVSRHDFTPEVIVLWRERTSARVGDPRTATGT